MSDGARARAAAAGVLARLLTHKGSLSTLLERFSSSAEAPLIQELCFGVCRYYYPLQSVLIGLLEKPLRSRDQDLHCLMLVGAYQVFCMRIPDHAALYETVQAAVLLRKPWARSLVNGVLRKVVAQKTGWQKLLESDQAELRYLHPDWLIARLRQDWPEHWQQILLANNQRAPMCLRVNLSSTTRSEYLQTLEKAQIPARPGKLARSAVYLGKPCPVGELPGFHEGQVSVQDEASQLVPEVLTLAPGLRVLDACAAPGGKTSHLLESEPSLTRLIALDIDGSRLEGIAENLHRLRLTAEVRQADAAAPDTWWDGQPLDRILLDAPCSATGVIRRHPDIKLLRRPEDIAGFADRQLTLLQRLWDCLTCGGLLLYTTCSVLKEENENTVERFLSQCGEAKYREIAADWGVQCRFGRQLLPDSEGNDGFYYALLEKMPGSR